MENGNKHSKSEPWEQQAGESNQAFAAFRCYLEMEKRSIRAVGRELGKSRVLMERWASRWKWPERIRKHTQHLTEHLDRKARKETIARRLPGIMSRAELLARLSMLARADPLMLFNKEGEFDINDVRRRGLGYLLAGVETVTTTYPSGIVVERKKFKIEPRAKFLELMGQHMGLWDPSIKDPDEVLSKYLGIPKHRLPPTFDAVGAILPPDDDDVVPEVLSS